MADEPEMTDPLEELDAGPPTRAPKAKRKPARRAKADGVGYDRKKCRYPGCDAKNSGPRFKNFCREHYTQMNPEPPEPVVAPAPKKETKTMAAAKTPTGPEGIPLDKLASMHEPLHVRLVRLRGIGPEEPIGLPGNGQGWSLTQVRNLEQWSRDALGGGDFSVKIVDERGQVVSWQWHNSGDEKKTSAQATTATVPGAASPPVPVINPVSPAPLNSTAATPANVVPIGNGLGMTTLANGMSIVVPMPNATDTAGPPANGPLNARAAAQVWGGNADAAQQFLQMTQRLERSEGEKERMQQQAQHDREMAEMRAAIAAMSKPAPVGPDPAVTARIDALAQQNADLQRQLAAKDVESRHREEMEAMRNSTKEQIAALTALIKENATPKEDPFLRMMMENQKETARSNAEIAKAQAEAAKEVARLQSEAQKETAREHSKTTEALLSKTDYSAQLAPMMNAFTSFSSLTSGMTATLLDVVKEVAEIKGEKGGNWAERLFGPLVEKLPEVGQTLAEGYALSQQAKLRGAPAATGTRPATGRQPRKELAENKPAELPPKSEASSPGNGEGSTPVKADPIELALRGYESSIPGEKEQYDASQWGPALPEIMKIRKAVLGSKIKPTDAAQALVQMVVYKSQMDLADQIPAFRFLQGDAEALATFVGLALGACPEKIDAATFMGFKRQALDVFVKLLQKASEEFKKAQAEENGDGDDDEVGDEETPDDGGEEPPRGDAPANPEIPGNVS